MSLETLIGQEGIDDIKDTVDKVEGKEFIINPDQGYDRNTFVDKANKLFDLQEHYSKLVKNVHDRQALEDVIDDLRDILPFSNGGNPFENPHHVVNEARRILAKSEYNMVAYVEHNRGHFLNLLDDKQLYYLVMSAELPFYKTGDKKHDQATELKNKIARLQKAQEEKQDPKDIVQGELKE